MLLITEGAGAKLAAILTGPNGPSDATLVVRISQHGGELGMTFDEATAHDATFEYRGETVLVMDAVLAKNVSKKTLDVKLMEHGSQLTLR